MINVIVYEDTNHDYVGFCSIGHAEMAEQGYDIVCASASILMINSVNAIETFTNNTFTLVENEEEGLLHFRLETSPSQETKTILKTMVLGIRTMCDSYEEYINLSIEEV